jgi:hypothetical protein
MKRVILVSIVFFILGFTLAHAQDCNIEYTGDSSGSITTMETTRTIAAAQQFVSEIIAFTYSMCSSENISCDADSCGVSCSVGALWHENAGASIYGTWSASEFLDNPSEPFEAGYDYSGIWDVICNDADLDEIPDDGDNSGNAENCDDNCRLTANPDQSDIDADSIGDACDDYYPECSIYLWNDDGSLRTGPIPTTETSQTIGAVMEVVELLPTSYDPSDCGCSETCCGCSDNIGGGIGAGLYWHKDACIDGTWEDSH